MWVTGLNMASNVLMLFANTYAARCLGPANLGVSAQVQALVQQLALSFNGGFDAVSVRLVAAGQEKPANVLRSVLVFRTGIALLLAVGWIVGVFLLVPAGPVRMAWMLGALLLVVLALQLPFLFQSIEQMPRFAAITAGTSLLVALTYAVAFHPEMPVGSDLLVAAVVGSVAAVSACMLACRLVHLNPATFFTHWAEIRVLLVRLLAQSWRYWLLAALTLVYTVLPVSLLAWLQGDSAAGILRVCLLFASGLEVVFASINSLLLPRLVRWLHEEGLDALWAHQKELLKAYLAFAVLVGLALLGLSPWIFTHLLGERYLPGLVPFFVFAAGRLVVFVGQIYSWGVVALRLDRQIVLATACAAAASLLLNVALVPSLSILGTALSALAAETILVTLAWLMQWHAVRAAR
nr:lipopolysaccharide biosynthesis protein [Ramlibacter agri]